jgi:hypothetical protein
MVRSPGGAKASLTLAHGRVVQLDSGVVVVEEPSMCYYSCKVEDLAGCWCYCYLETRDVTVQTPENPPHFASCCHHRVDRNAMRQLQHIC